MEEEIMRMRKFVKFMAADVQRDVLVVYCKCKIVYQNTGFHIFTLIPSRKIIHYISHISHTFTLYKSEPLSLRTKCN